MFAVAGACAALAGIGNGVMVATVSKSQQQAQLLTFCVNPPITLLSGATSPIENMPEFFQRLSYLDPLRYLVTIVRGITLKDALWPNPAILSAFARYANGGSAPQTCHPARAGMTIPGLAT